MTRHDLTFHDLHPDYGEPPYEPSRNAVEVIDVIIEEQMLYNWFSDAFDKLSKSIQEDFKENLQRAYDRWNEER